MMRSSRSSVAVAACLAMVLVLTAVQSAGAEEVANPQFQAWSKFGVGSSQTLTGTMGAAGPNGQQMTMETTRKLTEKADDHVTIEVTATVNVMGQQHTSPAHPQKVPATKEKKDWTQLGDEDVTAAGKTYHCKVYEGTDTTNPRAQNAKAKIWVSDDVPGGIVKMDVHTDRGQVQFLLKSYEAK